MAAYSGLTRRLKDKDTSVADRLKLSKFAWASEQVHIPNKRQHLLDYVCGLLVNKKKHNLLESEIYLTWKTLHLFLQASEHSVNVKPSILQAVVEDLNRGNVSKAKGHQELKLLNPDLQCVVLSSAYSLLELPSVGTAQFDLLCSVLGVACMHLASFTKSDGDADIDKLVRCVLVPLTKCVRHHLNQNQVAQILIDKILTGAIRAQAKCSKETLVLLQDFLVSCLMHSDHKEAYASYLRHQYGEPLARQLKLKQAPKIITALFNSLAGLIVKSEERTEAVKFVPLLLNAFLKENIAEPRLCFLMLKKVVEMILPRQEAALLKTKGDNMKGDAEREEREEQNSAPVPEATSDGCWWLDVVTDCLCVCQEHNGLDLFSKSVSKYGGDVLAWFSSLTQLVLQQSRISPWFKFQQHLLGLNHLLVEKLWATTLKDCLQSTHQEDKDTHSARDLFLCEIVSVYVKLRRSSDLMSALTDACVQCPGNVTGIKELPLFYARLCSMFNEAPLTSVLEMWEKLQERTQMLVSGLGTASLKGNLGSSVEWMLGLYAALISHARLFDHRTAAAFAPRVSRLVSAMEESVLGPLTMKGKVDQQCTSVSELVKAWSSLQVMLLPCWGGHVTEEHKGDDHSLKRWIQKTASSDQVRLGMQRLTVASPDGCPTVKEDVLGEVTLKKIFEKLLELPSLSPQLVTAIWDDISKDPVLTVAMSKYIQVCHLLPLVGRKLPVDVLEKCASLTVDIIAESCRLSPVELSNRKIPEDGQKSLELLANALLKHPAMRESWNFQLSLGSCVWRTLLQSGYQSEALSPPKKKKRKSLVANSSTSMLSGKYCTGDGQLCAFLRGESQDYKHQDNCSLQMHNWDQVSLEMLKLLYSFDLEYLPELNLKCQLGTTMLLQGFSHGDRSFPDSVCKRTLEKLFIRSMCVPNHSQLFDVLGWSTLLDIVVGYCSKVNTESAHTMLDVTAQAVMNEHRAVLKMADYVKNTLTKSLATDCTMEACYKYHLLALMVKYSNKYLKKAFHVEEVGTSAREMFRNIARFVITHGASWVSKSNLATTTATSRIDDNTSSPAKGKDKTPKLKKRKREQCEEMKSAVGESKVVGDTATEEGPVALEAWNDVLSCLAEVVAVWETEAVDEKFNKQLEGTVCHFVSFVYDRLQSRINSTQDSAKVELSFLQACCYCQLRCSSKDDSTLEETSTSNQLKLIDAEKHTQLWGLCFTRAERCVSVDAQHLSKDSPKDTVGGSKDDDKTNIDSWKADTCIYRCVKGAGSDTDVLCALLESVPDDGFPILLDKVLNCLATSNDQDPSATVVAVDVWRKLMASSVLSHQSSRLLFKQMYQILSSLLSVAENSSRLFALSSTAASPLSTVHAEVARFVVHALAQFTELGKSTVTPRMTLLCLHAGLSPRLAHPSDISVVCSLLNTLLVRHVNSALTAVPAVLHIMNKLIKACMTLGSQDQLTSRPDQVPGVVHSTQMVTRLLTLLSSTTYKAELQKVAHFVLAEYVTGLQKHPLHSAVKSELLRGLYKLMGVSDKYRLASLNASLAPGVKDTFKVMHQDYNKYHRYTGTV